MSDRDRLRAMLAHIVRQADGDEPWWREAVDLLDKGDEVEHDEAPSQAPRLGDRLLSAHLYRCRALIPFGEPGEYLRCMKPRGHDGTHHTETGADE